MGGLGRDGAWQGFAQAFALAAVAATAAAAGFIALMDPYGLRAAPGRPPRPIMDLNQRYMYPQVVRGGRYDAAVFGTSTARLLDPEALDRAFGARFANLAMNAATPWEQVQLADLFLREIRPRAVVFALDATWCEADADRRRLTPRPFPPWLYGDAPWRGYVEQANGRGLEIAGRLLLHRLAPAAMPPRIRADGYEVFTPPDAAYDPRRAAARIHAVVPPDGAASADPATPALVWLDALLARLPPEAVRIVAFMPVHVAAQPREDSAAARREAACKARVATMTDRAGGTFADFRIASPVTREDANYWDALHYRLPVAGRIVEGLRRAWATGWDDPEGLYRVAAPPG